MKKQTGFTLIELLVVVAIIALLVSILLPSLNEARTQAALVVDASNMRQVTIAAISYENDYGEFPPSMASLGPGTPAQDHPNDLNYNVSHTCDYLGIYITTPDVFLSPLGPPKPWYFEREYLQSSWPGRPEHYYLMSSYFLLWNFDLYNKQPEPIRFVGAKNLLDADADKLLTQTAVTWWVEGYVTGNRWRSQKPWEEVAGTGSTGTYFTPGTFGGVWPSDLPVNAGFMDGSVQRFIGSDLRYRGYPSNPGLVGFYLYDPDL